jgi:hypothetical protein
METRPMAGVNQNILKAGAKEMAGLVEEIERVKENLITHK